jgi:hypothetical protein
VAEWNSLQHPVASAFLAAVYSDYMLTSGKTELTCGGQSFTPADLRKFAQSQVNTPLLSSDIHQILHQWLYKCTCSSEFRT